MTLSFNCRHCNLPERSFEAELNRCLRVCEGHGAI